MAEVSCFVNIGPGDGVHNALPIHSFCAQTAAVLLRLNNGDMIMGLASAAVNSSVTLKFEPWLVISQLTLVGFVVQRGLVSPQTNHAQITYVLAAQTQLHYSLSPPQ